MAYQVTSKQHTARKSSLLPFVSASVTTDNGSAVSDSLEQRGQTVGNRRIGVPVLMFVHPSLALSLAKLVRTLHLACNGARSKKTVGAKGALLPTRTTD